MMPLAVGGAKRPLQCPTPTSLILAPFYPATLAPLHHCIPQASQDMTCGYYAIASKTKYIAGK
jgi:hypothetical protein